MDTIKDVISKLNEQAVSVATKTSILRRETAWLGISEIGNNEGEDLNSPSSSSVRSSPSIKQTWSGTWSSPLVKAPPRTPTATTVQRLPSEILVESTKLPPPPSTPIDSLGSTTAPVVVAPRPVAVTVIKQSPAKGKFIKKGPPPLKIDKLKFTDKLLRPVEKVASRDEVEVAKFDITKITKPESPTEINGCCESNPMKGSTPVDVSTPIQLPGVDGRSGTPPLSKDSIAGRSWKDYSLESRALGAGAFGQVFKAQLPVNGCRCTVAIKRISVQTDQMTKELQQEILWVSTSKPKHSCIVDTYDVFHVPEKFELWIVQEFMSKGSLDKVVGILHCKRLDEMITASIVHQLLQALDFLKSQKYLHRDIKPANILVNEKGCVKLADFGAATYAGTIGVALSFGQGTQAYMSPERLTGQPYTVASDVWSAGIITAELIMGKFPISCGGFIEQIELCKSFCDSLTANDLLTDRSAEVVDFIRLSVLPDPEQRASSIQLLSHQFIKTHCMGGHGHSSNNVKNWLSCIFSQDPAVPPMR